MSARAPAREEGACARGRERAGASPVPARPQSGEAAAGAAERRRGSCLPALALRRAKAASAEEEEKEGEDAAAARCEPCCERAAN